jgi:hypothetical protein
MKTFCAGIVVAYLGFSGVANLMDYAMKIVQTHTQQLNAQLEQIGN